MELGRSLQEYIISIISYDDENCTIIRGLVDQEMFDGDFRPVVRILYGYIDRYGLAPKDNTLLLMEKLVEGNSPRAQFYLKLIMELKETYTHANKTFILDKLKTFIRKQRLKRDIIKAAEIIQSTDDDTSLDKARQILTSSFDFEDTILDDGVDVFHDTSIFSFLGDQDDDQDRFLSGIPILDNLGVMPGRGKLYTVIGGSNVGKSWVSVHLGKMSLLQGYNVLHVTLEMSERQVIGRYAMSCFAIGQKDIEAINITRIQHDDNYNWNNFELETYRPKLRIGDNGTDQSVRNLIDKFRPRLGNLRVKGFPMRALTINGLKGYLDLLERRRKFTPDILILDYADLMSVDVDNYRISLEALFQSIRGLATERNFAMVTFTQSNREGMKSTMVTGINVAESYSKHQVSDVIITLSQTQAENDLGLIRMFVDKNRDGQKGAIVGVSQCYSIGQFHLQSCRLNGEKHDEWLQSVESLSGKTR